MVWIGNLIPATAFIVALNDEPMGSVSVGILHANRCACGKFSTSPCCYCRFIEGRFRSEVGVCHIVCSGSRPAYSGHASKQGAALAGIYPARSGGFKRIGMACFDLYESHAPD
jgi:hypothetical protein